MIDLDLDHILFIDRIRDWPIMVRLSSPTKTSLRIASGQIQPVWREPKMNVKKERIRESYIIAKIWKFSQKYFKIFAEKIFRINFEANFFDCLKSCFQLILRKNILIFSLWFSEKILHFPILCHIKHDSYGMTRENVKIERKRKLCELIHVSFEWIQAS